MGRRTHGSTACRSHLLSISSQQNIPPGKTIKHMKQFFWLIFVVFWIASCQVEGAALTRVLYKVSLVHAESGPRGSTTKISVQPPLITEENVTTKAKHSISTLLQT